MVGSNPKKRKKCTTVEKSQAIIKMVLFFEKNFKQKILKSRLESDE